MMVPPSSKTPPPSRKWQSPEDRPHGATSWSEPGGGVWRSGGQIRKPTRTLRGGVGINSRRHPARVLGELKFPPRRPSLWDALDQIEKRLVDPGLLGGRLPDGMAREQLRAGRAACRRSYEVRHVSDARYRPRQDGAALRGPCHLESHPLDNTGVEGGAGSHPVAPPPPDATPSGALVVHDAEGPLLTVREAAPRLRVSRATGYRLVRARSLPTLRVSNSIRIPAGAPTP